MLFIYFYDAVYKRAKNFWGILTLLIWSVNLKSAVFCQIANETLQNVAGSHFIHVVEGLNCQDYARNVVCKTFFALLTRMKNILWRRRPFLSTYASVGQLSNTRVLIIFSGSSSDWFLVACPLDIILFTSKINVTCDCFGSWLLALAGGQKGEHSFLPLHRETGTKWKNVHFHPPRWNLTESPPKISRV